MTAEVMNSLIIRSQQGDRGAFAELYEETYPKTFNFLYRYIKSEDNRKDILQNTFLAAWLSIGNFDTKKSPSFSSWVFAIARRRSADFFVSTYGDRRRSDRRTFVDISNCFGILTDGDDDYDDVAAADLEKKRALIIEAAEKLSPAQKTAFRLIHIEGKSLGDACKIMGQTKEQLRAHLYHARGNVVKYVKSPNWYRESMIAHARTTGNTKAVKRAITPAEWNLISLYLKDL
jgi:RNA polymerase sigma-70 factor (ECF subfamily)